MYFQILWFYPFMGFVICPLFAVRCAISFPLIFSCIDIHWNLVLFIFCLFQYSRLYLEYPVFVVCGFLLIQLMTWSLKIFLKFLYSLIDILCSNHLSDCDRTDIIFSNRDLGKFVFFPLIFVLCIIVFSFAKTFVFEDCIFQALNWHCDLVVVLGVVLVFVHVLVL